MELENILVMPSPMPVMQLNNQSEYDKCLEERAYIDKHRPRSFIQFTGFKSDGDLVLGTEQRIIYSIYSSILVFLALYMYKRANRKIRLIKKRDADIPNAEHDTYVVTSLLIVKISKYQLGGSILRSFVNILMLNIPAFQDP